MDMDRSNFELSALCPEEIALIKRFRREGPVGLPVGLSGLATPASPFSEFTSELLSTLQAEKVDKFDPDTISNAHLWLNQFSRAKQGLRPSLLCNKLLSNLSGRATLWANKFADITFTDSDWSELKDAFLSEFALFESEKALQALRSRTFLHGECLERYFLETENDFNTTHKPELWLVNRNKDKKLKESLDVQLRDALAAGLPLDLAEIIRQHKDYYKAKKLTLQKEFAWRAQRRTISDTKIDPAPATVSASPPTPVIVQPVISVPVYFAQMPSSQADSQPHSQTLKYRCFKCGQRGHKQFSCTVKDTPAIRPIKVTQSYNTQQGNVLHLSSQGLNPGCLPA